MRPNFVILVSLLGLMHSSRVSAQGRRGVPVTLPDGPGKDVVDATKKCTHRTGSSGPHGLVADTAGNLWFTANSKGYIGKLVPQPGAITEYPLPPAARDPHTPIFDQKGILWFTAQGANMVGRLD